MLEKILESPLDNRRTKQLILSDTNPEYSLEGLMLKLKLHCFGLMGRANSLEKTLMLGKAEGKRRRRQRMRRLESITDPVQVNLGELWEAVRRREAWRAAVHGVSGERAN